MSPGHLGSKKAVPTNQPTQQLILACLKLQDEWMYKAISTIYFVSLGHGW